MFFFRDAASSQACAGHLGGVRQRRGEPGRVEASQRQPHPGPPVGVGETQLTAGGQSLKLRGLLVRSEMTSR